MTKNTDVGDMETSVHRTLEFAAMRDNIAECVDLVDAQTFGIRAN
ncbi:hypothetical protein ACFQFH_08365 [Halobaculum halobium]|nr:hypothetical protein [Halobaculum sp. SYNS20]